jgi:hypothetical protein
MNYECIIDVIISLEYIKGKYKGKVKVKIIVMAIVKVNIFHYLPISRENHGLDLRTPSPGFGT